MPVPGPVPAPRRCTLTLGGPGSGRGLLQWRYACVRSKAMHSEVFKRRKTSPAVVHRSVVFLAIQAASLGALHASLGSTAPSSCAMASLTADSKAGKLGKGCHCPEWGGQADGGRVNGCEGPREDGDGRRRRYTHGHRLMSLEGVSERCIAVCLRLSAVVGVCCWRLCVLGAPWHCRAVRRPAPPPTHFRPHRCRRPPLRL